MTSLPPLLRQLRDPLGLGRSAQSKRSATLTPRTKTADRVVQSICPYCAVGCGQKVYVSGEKIVQIEGDPDSPISRGRLCPKGAGSLGYVNSPIREYKVKYRRPGGSGWEPLELDTAMDMIADRIIKTRARAGTDIAYLRAVNNYLLEDGRESREYVRAYPNPHLIIKKDFEDTEDLDGLFSGYQPDDHAYKVDSWGYDGTSGELTAGRKE